MPPAVAVKFTAVTLPVTANVLVDVVNVKLELVVKAPPVLN